LAEIALLAIFTVL